jgi:hypothetical protein
MKRAAVFTIMQDEPRFLPIWLAYYRQHFDAEDIYVLNHDSKDPATLAVLAREPGIHIVPVHNEHSFDHIWLRDTVVLQQQALLREYQCVLFAEIDEMVFVNPLAIGALPSLREYIDHFLALPDSPYQRCTGWNVVHRPDRGEANLDWHRPLLPQRRFCHRHPGYNKYLLSKVPLSWNIGFHILMEPVPEPNQSPPGSLDLLHIHQIDYDYTRERHRKNFERKWSPSDLQQGFGVHNRMHFGPEFDSWYSLPMRTSPDGELPELPDAWKNLLPLPVFEEIPIAIGPHWPEQLDPVTGKLSTFRVKAEMQPKKEKS